MAEDRPYKLDKRHCCICGNKKSENQRLFSVPRNEEKRRKWMELLDREDILELDVDYVRNNARVCDAHFHEWAFGSTERLNLIRYALPTLEKPPLSAANVIINLKKPRTESPSTEFSPIEFVETSYDIPEHSYATPHPSQKVASIPNASQHKVASIPNGSQHKVASIPNGSQHKVTSIPNSSSVRKVTSIPNGSQHKVASIRNGSSVRKVTSTPNSSRHKAPLTGSVHKVSATGSQPEGNSSAIKRYDLREYVRFQKSEWKPCKAIQASLSTEAYERQQAHIDRVIQRQQKYIDDLKREIDEYATGVLPDRQENMTDEQHSFLMCLVKQCQNKMRNETDKELKDISFEMYSHCPKMYQFLRTKLPLPCRSTLKRKAKEDRIKKEKEDFEEGDAGNTQ